MTMRNGANTEPPCFEALFLPRVLVGRQQQEWGYGLLGGSWLATGGSGCWPGWALGQTQQGLALLLFLCCSDEWKRPLSHGYQWGTFHPQRLQQWACDLFHCLPLQPPAPSSLWRPPAQQAEALPDHPAAVWQRHLSGDRGARPHLGAGPGGECPPLGRVLPSLTLTRQLPL